MHQPGLLILWFTLGALAVTGLGGAVRWLSTPERVARRGLRSGLGGRPDLVLTAADGASAALRMETGRIAVRRSRRHAAEAFDQDDLVGAELVADGQVVARCWRGEPRRALDRTPETPTRLDLRLAFAQAVAAEVVLTAWNVDADRPETERAAAIEAARRWFAQMDAMVRAPRRETRAD